MKIASLSPQFVVETPEGEKDRLAEKAVLEGERHLRVVTSTDKAIEGDEPENDSGDGPLDRETREGLKRLKELVREKSGTELAIEELARRQEERQSKKQNQPASQKTAPLADEAKLPEALSPPNGVGAAQKCLTEGAKPRALAAYARWADAESAAAQRGMFFDGRY